MKKENNDITIDQSKTKKKKKKTIKIIVTNDNKSNNNTNSNTNNNNSNTNNTNTIIYNQKVESSKKKKISSITFFIIYQFRHLEHETKSFFFIQTNITK